MHLVFIWLISFGVIVVVFIHVVVGINMSFFFLLLSGIPLYGYTTLCLFVYLLMDVWVVSSFQLLKLKLP